MGNWYWNGKENETKTIKGGMREGGKWKNEEGRRGRKKVGKQVV